MNGATAQRGHVYQKEYVAWRVLASEARRLIIDDGSICVSRFSVEGKTSGSGPAWDVSLWLEDGSIELLECKDTPIRLSDRTTFYERVRKEMASDVDVDSLFVGWVTDSTKQSSNILKYLAEARELARAATEVDCRTSPARVSSGEDAYTEAMHHLTVASDEDAPSISIEDAHRIVSRLQIHTHVHGDLSQAVRLLARGLFDAGSGDAIHTFIVGEFASRIASDGLVEFERQEFLDAVGTVPLAMTARDQLREILEFHSAAGPPSEIPRIVWEQIPGRPQHIWGLDDRLGGVEACGSVAITADTGVGKTVTSWQLFDAQQNVLNAHHVLRFAADDVETDCIRALPRLISVLSGVASTWIVIDALDEIDRPLVTTWRQTLTRLLGIPRCTVVITVRREVLSAYDWLQQLVDPLMHVCLQQLSPDQVADAFRVVGLPVPESRALIECLRNPFLFSLYAKVATPADLPLRCSGEVTGFHVIEQYWQRRVVARSQGLRAGTTEDNTARHKRIAMAYLQTRSLGGADTFAIDGAGDEESLGIESLLCEGVLVRRGTGQVAWTHDWVMQYALLDKITQQIPQPSPEALADAIAGIVDDHVRRVACVGATKWILVCAAWGPVERFLVRLCELNAHLPSEALPIFVEAAADSLQLAALGAELIIRFIEIAIQLEAVHWVDVIDELPDNLFCGQHGPALLDTVIRYSEKVEANG